jgi:hypothetical protein
VPVDGDGEFETCWAWVDGRSRCLEVEVFSVGLGWRGESVLCQRRTMNMGSCIGPIAFREWPADFEMTRANLRVHVTLLTL